MKYFIGIILMLVSLFAEAQPDNVGPGHALYFNGQDGEIDLGDVYNDLDFPFTISFWIYLSESKNNIAPVFASEEGSFLYHGFWVRVTKTNIGLAWGDGQGGNHPSFRRAWQQNVADISGKWTHVAISAQNENSIELYLNGIDVGEFVTGTSNLNMSFNTNDHARIGKFYTNGEVWRMHGWLDEMRIWDYTRDITQIRTDMCRKIPADSPGLIGYWNFNETSGGSAFDESTNSLHGNLVGPVQRGYSGAPIGDESIFTYGDVTSIAMMEGSDRISIENPSFEIQGVHIYKVNQLPSQLNFPTDGLRPYYFGIYTATNSNTVQTFDLSIQGTCQLLTRFDNSIARWNSIVIDEDLLFKDQVYRGEYLFRGSNSNELDIQLGSDISTCEPFHIIQPDFVDGDYNIIEWQDGSKSENLRVTSSGKYWVEIRNDCYTSSDTINILFQTPINDLDIGMNSSLCQGESLLLTPSYSGTYSELTWQDGSNDLEYQVTQPGIYWLEMSNACNTIRDSISIESPEIINPFIPNVLTSNDDALNESFQVDPQLQSPWLRVFNRWGKEIFNARNYQNNWSGKNNPPGIYFYFIKDECSGAEFKGSISLLK